MDKNTVIGLSLIGVLLVTFTYLNQPSQAELAKKAKTEKALKEKAAAQEKVSNKRVKSADAVSYTHLRAHETN
jgi:YidC/Oxa1 family membrane protein insertase